MDLPTAPAASADVWGMHTFSPKTTTTYDVADALSLQFAWHSLAK